MKNNKTTLNIMKYLDEDRLEYLNIKNNSFTKNIGKTKKELQRKLDELSLLYESSKEIGYILNFQELMRIIMDSLYKVVDYQVCASLLLSEEENQLNIRVSCPVSDVFIQEVKSKLLASVTYITGRNFFKGEKIAVRIEKKEKVESGEGEHKEKVRSFFNVPLIFKNQLMGMINVSSLKENAFSDEDIRIIYALANQASIAIERLRSIISTEKSKMEAMVKSMVEGIIMADNQEKLVVINPAAKILLGFNPNEWVTRKKLIQSFKEAGVEGFFTKRIDFKEEKVSKEIYFTKPKPRTLYITHSLVKGTKGERLGSVMSIRDITAEKDVDRMKTEFISTVSHELRTPLSITREGISLVLDKIPGKINKKQDKILTIAKNNIDRLARIISGLLDISKIESGKVELKKECVNIKSLIEQVVSSFEPKIKGKGLELKVNLPQEELEVLAEGDKIIEVFTNLLGNALKFTEKGYLEVSAIELKDEIECTVKDTGIGLAMDDLPKVFGKFQQFGRIDSEGEKGTGLGLSISKGIIEAHHGKIWVESTLGIGSKFIFTLPKYIAIKEFYSEYIDGGIREAIKMNSKMSLLLVSIFELDKLKQKLTRQIFDSTLKNIEEMIRNNHVRSGDVVVSENNQNMVLVNNCDQESILKVENRLEKMLVNYLKDRNLTKEIKFVFGSATYPDDGLYAEKLLEVAKKSECAINYRKLQKKEIGGTINKND